MFPATPAHCAELAWQALENLRHEQASSLAYFDVFWLLAEVAFVPVLVVLLMKRSDPKKVRTPAPSETCQ